MPLSFSSLFPTIAALAAVLALVLLAARAARLAGLARPGPRAGTTRLALDATLQLDRTRRLHLVRCDGRDLLLLTGGASDEVVGWLPRVDEGAAP